MILYAGMVAESQFTGEYCQQGAAQDLMSIKRLLRDRVSTNSQFERMTRRLLGKAEHILGEQRHAKAIQWIAKDLIARTTIRGRAVRHFFDQANERIVALKTITLKMSLRENHGDEAFVRV